MKKNFLLNAKQFTYSKVGNRPFYIGLRTCWGKMIHSQNGCPYYRGDEACTGSIGWENTAHGHHMHLSVPYCLNGAYGPHLWRSIVMKLSERPTWL